MKDAKSNSAASKAKATAEKSTAEKSTAGANALESVKAQSGTKQDAEALLKADHRKVEQLFQQYKNAGEDSDKKSELAQQVCKELIVHSKLEEEIFYPACREKDVDDDLLDEAQVEHDGAKIMIAELMQGSPDDDYYDAKLTVLSEYIKHHVGEEEKTGDGIFAKARKAGVDMNALGARLQARKSELMGNIEALSSRPPRPRSLNVNSGRQTNQENFSMARYSNDRDRDEQGRFTSDDDDNRGRSSSRSGYSSRSSRGYDYDDDRGNGRRSSSSNDRERDDQGRFMSEDDNGRGNSRRSSSSSNRERDDQGRFMSDDDNGRGNGRRSSGSNDRDRDEYGRFTSDDDDNRYRSSSRGGYSSRSSRDNDDDRGGQSSRGRGQGGWFGDSEGHSEAAERGWEGRESSRGGSSSRRSSRDDDDDDRGGRSSRSSSGRGGQGHGGWFGDSEGHSEAAERGWENRQSSRGGYSSSSRRSNRDDDDNDRGGRSSRSRSSEGHGGWFGDSRGHAEAARKGWQDR